MYLGADDPIEIEGTMVNTLELDGRWVHQKFTGKDDDDCPIPTIEGRGYFGYSTANGQYEGFWIDNTSTTMNFTTGITNATGLLSDSQAAGQNFAKAIMTTDTRAKQAAQTVEIYGKTVTIAGTSKGAGMIGPNMATTICVVTTDAAISKPLLGKAFKNAIGISLNRLTVDGHQSTNDTAIILASGQAENKAIKKQDSGYRRFSRALSEVCSDLARQMALDAEGATRMFTVEVKGAAKKQDAFKAARAVADYDLVKCAVHGADPNWGRIICAVGSCGVRLSPDKLSCKIGDIFVFKNGKPTNFNPKAASAIIARKEHTITIDLGVGKYSDVCYGCDLSREYVRINADYHT